MTGRTRFHDQAVEGDVRDAASVVLLRDDKRGGIEVFLLRRGGSSTVMHDAYVFPGGKVDPEDGSPSLLASLGLPGEAAQLLGEPGLDAALAGALFVAACRETFEETGVSVRAVDLMPLSRWITPKVPAMMRRRFDTRFFVAALPDGAEATHDGQEADASVWYSPRAALEAYRDHQIMLAPPQIMTLAGLGSMGDLASLRDRLRRHVPCLVEPVSFQEGEGRTIVYPGHPRHPVSQRAMPGPTSLVYRNDHFEPLEGFEAFFQD